MQHTVKIEAKVVDDLDFISLNNEIFDGSSDRLNSTSLVFKACQSSVINLTKFEKLSTLHLINSDKCILIVNLSSSLFLENCHHCLIISTCQQLRIYASSFVDFYLDISSRPTIEDSKNMLFASLKNREEIIVNDFNWLSQVKSPNWSLFEQENTVACELYYYQTTKSSL